jgi:phospholipid transport system substrate-binding protein
MSRSILAVFSLVFLVLATFCIIASPANASKEEAGVFVETLAKDVIAMIGNKSLSKDDKRDKLESIFGKHVDIDWIAQFVLGKHWRAATDEQKKKYLVNYHKFLLLNYTSNFENFADTRFEIEKSEAGNKAGEYVIGMVLKRPNQQDLKVDYRLREDGNSNYKVIDIVAEGISLITSQRSEFNSVVTRNGLDYLIDQLASKTIKVAVD